MSGIWRSPASASLDADDAGSVVVANLDTSAIHRIDRTGAAIWSAIGRGRTTEAIAAAAAESLGIEPSAAFSAACGAFVAELETLGLVTRTDPYPPVRSTGQARAGERADEPRSRRDRRHRRR